MPAPVNLTVDHVLSLAHAAGLSLPKWNWPPLKSYRGFTHEQRVLGWQAQWAAIRMGLLEPACGLTCRQCGTTERINYHSDDYNTLEGLVPLCASCHFAIHRSSTLLTSNAVRQG